MKSNLLLIAFGTLLLTASQSQAASILVDEWLSSSSGNSAEKIAVRTAINDYNTANNPDLSQIFDNTNPPPGNLPNLLAGWVELTPGPTSNFSTDNGINSVLNWVAPGDYAEYYILTKWGAARGGPNAASMDTALHHLLAGDSIVNYNPGGSTSVNSLSHVRIWAGGVRQVPDGGVTVLLLGAALTALGFVRRRVVG